MARSDSAGTGLFRMRVLLVDDDEDDYVLTRDLFQQMQDREFDLQWLATYDEGLHAILEDRHDVYLLDYRLGERSGLELLREARKRGCRAAVILLTGQGDHGVDLDALRAGASDYLTKNQITAPLLEHALRYSVERVQAEQGYRVLFEANPSPVLICASETGRILAVNEAAVEQYGFSRSEFLALCLSDLDQEQSTLPPLHQLAFNFVPNPKPMPRQHRKKDGTIIDVEMVVRDLQFAGRKACLLLTNDVTERLRADAALRFREEQLRQSQKMEAVRRLAGGIAHDFNNLLMAVNGYSEVILSRLGPEDPLRSDVEEIRKAGLRAADLTRRLLAFSRKQVLAPQVLDLNLLVANMDKMLRHLIGENIELVSVTCAQLGKVRAEPGQIEQVILNLVVNARDAMPGGGKLILETANVDLDDARAARHPELTQVTRGHYVMLAVSDTGCGMDADTQAHLFEPFFTTKEAGKGTGLGLSTVYGIVKQSGGHVWVFSEPGQGSTVKVYLPMVDEPPPVAPAPAFALKNRSGWRSHSAG